MTRWIERLLNLHRGDLNRAGLLFAYLFFIMASNIVGKIAGAALFLGKFKAQELPYVDISLAVLVGFVVAGYVRIARRVGLQSIVLGSVLFFATNAVVFWWFARVYQWPWLYKVFYVWAGTFGVLAPMQVWTLVNYVLTTREAKRLVGLVGSGAIAGSLFAGYFSKALAPRVGTEILLLSMAVFLAVSAVLVVLIWRGRHQAVLAGAEEAEEPATQAKPTNLLESLRQVWASPYLRAIAGVVGISSLVVTVTKWQFLAIAQHSLVTKDALAGFLGAFNFYTSLISITAQFLLTGRLLRRFGVGPALCLLPVIVLAGSVGVLVWGTLAAAVFLKGSDYVLRYSVDRSTAELLYLPVPANVKLQAKSIIDTVIWRIGDGLAGVTVLVFATYWHWSAQRLSWVVLVLVAGWLIAAVVAPRQYVSTLRESIQQHRLDAERASAPVLDRSTTDLLAANLAATDPKEILYALSLFDLERRQAVHPAVRDLLHHPAPEVKQKAIGILAAAGDRSVQQQIEQLLNDPHLGVRTEALLYLAHHAHIDPLARLRELGNLPDFSIRSGMVAFLARPGPTQSLATAELILDDMAKQSGPDGKRARLEAGRLIGELPDKFDEQLRLLTDQDTEVAECAIRAVGALQARRFIPRMLERLVEPELAPAIVESLGRFGDRIVGTVRDHLTDPDVPLGVRREIPNILARVGTQAAENALVENLLQPDTTLRFRIISALNKIHERNLELKLDTQMIETILAAEIMGHYRSYQILGTLGGNLDGHDAVLRALRESMEQELERIFRLLALLFPQFDFHSAYFGLQSTSRIVHDNALEFLDNVLKPQLRNVLVPLLDSGVSVADRVRLANRLVGAKVESQEEAVAALMCTEDPWLKSCGAYAIGTLGLKSLERELDSCLNDPDPLLRETARQAKLRLAGPSQPTGS